MKNLYAINPKETPRPFPVPIELVNARSLNNKGHDIYWTFNEFSAPGRRTKSDLRKICAFYCEVDGITEGDLTKKLKENLPPSLVIKTKNGFHLYWYLLNPVDCSQNPVELADWFHEFVKTRILPVFNADPQACDACRLLRMPMYKYWKRQKDGTYPKGDFYTDIVFDNEETKYSLEQLMKFFPEKKEIKKVATERSGGPEGDDNFWTRANKLPCRETLEKLSGSTVINCEVLSFRKQKNITRILVNGRESNAWLDANGMIGSTAGAAPAIPNWLYFYSKDWKEVRKILIEFFPELDGMS